MADTDAFKKRSQELFSEHEEWQDFSLLHTFPLFLDDYYFGGYEKMLAGETSEEILAMMDIESNVKMSEEGLATLRQAAAIEPDQWTADLHKKNKVMERLCAELESSDAITISTTLNEAIGAKVDSQLQRYEELLASLSPGDRAALDTVFFNRKAGKLKYTARRPVNADHIWDTLATEFPDEVLERAKRECERNEVTMRAVRANKGKRTGSVFIHVSSGSIRKSSGSRQVGE